MRSIYGTLQPLSLPNMTVMVSIGQNGRTVVVIVVVVVLGGSEAYLMYHYAFTIIIIIIDAV